MNSDAGYHDHVLGPLKLIVSVPWETVCTFEVLNSGPFRKLYGLCESGNILFIKLGERLFFTLNISITSFCKFLWWIVNDLSISKSSSNVDLESLYANHKAL